LLGPTLKHSPSEQIAAICRCTDELARLRFYYGSEDQNDRLGITIGEADWLEELHRLLYEVTFE
jgi:hypothetical protein